MNAIAKHSPRLQISHYLFVETNDEPSFPIVKGTCSFNAMSKLSLEYIEKLSSSISVLDVYKFVREEMGIIEVNHVDAHLQP